MEEMIFYFFNAVYAHEQKRKRFPLVLCRSEMVGNESDALGQIRRDVLLVDQVGDVGNQRAGGATGHGAQMSVIAGDDHRGILQFHLRRQVENAQHFLNRELQRQVFRELSDLKEKNVSLSGGGGG